MSPHPDWLDRLAWLATPDERLLWAILAATAIAAAYGVFVGLRSRPPT